MSRLCARFSPPELKSASDATPLAFSLRILLCPKASRLAGSSVAGSRREPDGECRAALRSIGRFDPAAVFFDDPARDGQSESRALADLFGREERIEDVLEALRRESLNRCPIRATQRTSGPLLHCSSGATSISRLPPWAIACSALTQMFINTCRNKSPITIHKIGEWAVMIVPVDFDPDIRLRGVGFDQFNDRCDQAAGSIASRRKLNGRASVSNWRTMSVIASA